MTTIRTNTVTTLRTTIHPLAALLFLAFAPAALAQDKPAPAGGSAAQTQARSGPGRASKDGRIVSVSYPPGTAIATIQVDFAWKPEQLPLTEADLSVIAGRFTDPRTGEQYEMLPDSAVPADLGKGWKAARITTGWLHRLGSGLSGALEERQALATKKQAITSAINNWLEGLDRYAGLTKKIADPLYDQKNQAEQQLRQLDAEHQLPLLQQRLRELQIELFAKKARMAAMQKKIAEIRDQAGAKSAEDPILKELKEIAKIRGEAVTLAQQRMSASEGSAADFKDAQAKAMEARVQVALRQEAVAAAVGGDVLTRLTSDLAMLSVDLAELKAREDMTADETNRLRAQTEACQAQVQSARKAIDEAKPWRMLPSPEPTVKPAEDESPRPPAAGAVPGR
jgi:hypothetical protein